MTGPHRSPWSAGHLRGQGPARLLFGVTYEDVVIEEQVLATCRRVFAVGGGGDTPLQLASGDRRVTAVDVNPAQAAYLRLRLRGSPPRHGRVDRLLAAARRVAPAVGWTRPRVERFLGLSDVATQRRVFDQMLDTARFRALLDVGLAPPALLRVYRPELVGFLPRPFGPVIRRRLRGGISTHPNATNPYARLLFTGTPPEVPRAPVDTVDVLVAEAAEFLDEQPRGSFDGFTLSNVLDGPGLRFRLRLASAVAHCGSPAAPVVLRTFREPVGQDDAAWATRDRSMLWGGIIVSTAAEFPSAVEALQ